MFVLCVYVCEYEGMLLYYNRHLMIEWYDILHFLGAPNIVRALPTQPPTAISFPYCKCNFPMTRSVRLLLVGWSVGRDRLVGIRSVCHNFLKELEVTLPCSYRSISTHIFLNFFFFK